MQKLECVTLIIVYFQQPSDLGKTQDSAHVGIFSNINYNWVICS